jgi:hypothetical protein
MCLVAVDILQIANTYGVPGTIATIVCNSQGTSFLLTNHHVAFGEDARAGDPVWAIPPDFGGDTAGEMVCVGFTRSGFIGRVTFNGEPYFIDCALVELEDSSLMPSWLQRAISIHCTERIVQAEAGMPVCKSGAVTGLTNGVIIDVAYPDHPYIEGRSWIAPRQLLVKSTAAELNFSARGDSGSALLDMQGSLVGLLWGCDNNGHGIACPIEPVLDFLDVVLAPQACTTRRSA